MFGNSERSKLRSIVPDVVIGEPVADKPVPTVNVIPVIVPVQSVNPHPLVN